VEDAVAARFRVRQEQEEEAGEGHGGADGEVEVRATGCYGDVGGAAVDGVGWAGVRWGTSCWRRYDGWVE
jgi:hypothetical protein